VTPFAATITVEATAPPSRNWNAVETASRNRRRGHRDGRSSDPRDQHGGNRRRHPALFEPGSQQGLRPLQPAAQGADAAAQLVRRLGVRASADEAQHDRIAELPRELRKLIVENDGEVRVFGPVRLRCIRGLLPTGFPLAFGAALLAGPHLSGDPACDPDQPAADRPRCADRAGAAGEE